MDGVVLHRNHSLLACSSPEYLREVAAEPGVRPQLRSLFYLSSHQLAKSKAAGSDFHEQRKEKTRRKEKRGNRRIMWYLKEVNE